MSESSSDCDVLSLDCSDFESIDEQEIIDLMNSQKAEKTKRREAEFEQPTAVKEMPEVVDLEAEVQTVAVISPSPFERVDPQAYFMAPWYQQHPYVYQAPAPQLMQQPLHQNFHPYYDPSGFQQFHPYYQYPFDSFDFTVYSTSQGPNLATDNLQRYISRTRRWFFKLLLKDINNFFVHSA